MTLKLLEIKNQIKKCVQHRMNKTYQFANNNGELYSFRNGINLKNLYTMTPNEYNNPFHTYFAINKIIDNTHSASSGEFNEKLENSLLEHELLKLIYPLNYMVLADVFLQYKLPILIIDNNDLLGMIENTDLSTDITLDDINLPIDYFVLKFTLHDQVTVEAMIGTAASIERTTEIATIMFVYTSNTCLLIDSPLRKITDEYLEGFNYRIDILLGLKVIVNNIRKILMLFSMPKNISYITAEKKKHEFKQNTLPKKMRQSVPTIHLFNEFRYIYNEANEGDQRSKSAHLVRGHIRKQPHGNKNNPEYKIIWIKPYYTGGQLQDENKIYKVVA